MSIKYEVNFAEDTLAGMCTKRKGCSEEKKWCHEFALCYEEAAVQSSVIQVLATKIVSEDWLFGPASLLASRSVIYPCSRFRCSIPCPCQDCRKCFSPLPCQ